MLLKRLLWMLGSLLLLVLALGAIYWFYPFSHTEAKHKALLPVTVSPVKSVELEEKLESIGTAKANESVVLSANVTERVNKIYFDDGHFVKRGATLVELASDEEMAQLKEANAKLTEAERNYKRIFTLTKQRVLPKSDLDTSEAVLLSAQAQVKAIRARIKDRTIVAPFDGILGFRKVSEGAMVEPGDEIVTLDDIEKVKVDFTFPEKFLGSIKVGQQIIATSVAYPERKIVGFIKTIGSRVDPASRSVVVRAIIANPEDLLKPGMLLTIQVIVSQRQAMIIPESALVPVHDTQYVFVLEKGNKVKRVAVEVGLRRYGLVEITKGLKPGMTIIADGGFKLESGEQVRVVTKAQALDG